MDVDKRFIHWVHENLADSDYQQWETNNHTTICIKLSDVNDTLSTQRMIMIEESWSAVSLPPSYTLSLKPLHVNQFAIQ